MEQVKSFIVHIYQHQEAGAESKDEHKVIGVVEGVESEIKIPFTSSQQLWEILEQKPPEGLTIVQHTQGKYSS